MQAKLFCFFFFSLYFILHSTTKDSTITNTTSSSAISCLCDLWTYHYWQSQVIALGSKLPFLMKKSVTSCLVYSLAHSWARGIQAIISFQMVWLVHAICNGNIPNHIFSPCRLVTIVMITQLWHIKSKRNIYKQLPWQQVFTARKCKYYWSSWPTPSLAWLSISSRPPQSYKGVTVTMGGLGAAEKTI